MLEGFVWKRVEGKQTALKFGSQNSLCRFGVTEEESLGGVCQEQPHKHTQMLYLNFYLNKWA